MRYRSPALILALTLLTGLTALPTRAGEAETPQAPRLAVLVVFDQMRGDYLARWGEQFGDDGFRRILRDGTWFKNCHYPYAYTITAAGHASMVTGCSPDRHGIVGNSWYDRERGKVIEAVESDRHFQVPTLDRRVASASPERRLQPSVADALVDQTKGKAKVVSVSIKDRAAILMAALRSLLCAWFDDRTGQVVTSSYYADRLPGWLTDFNKGRPADRYFGKSWERLRPDLDYAQLSGPDDFPYEGTGYKQGRTFPHPLTGGLEKPGQDYYESVANSPFGNDLLLELAQQAIVHEQLGQDDVPDLLCLGMSSNDMVGHCWGPDSQEVLDVTLRSDALMARLLRFLDDKVGKGRYLVVVCADHGVCPLPEKRLADGHKDAGRVAPSPLFSGARAHLDAKFGGGQKQPWIESTSGGMVYLNHGTVKSLNLKPADVERELAGWLRQQPGLAGAYTAAQFADGPLTGDPIGQMARRSYYPGRSGDVMPILKPYHLLGAPLDRNKTGAYTTTHGSPWEYDTHVPLLVYGAGVRPGCRDDRVTPQAVAGIIAAGLGIEPPAGADTPVPARLFE